MSAAFGVHLGCTSACLAVYKDGKTDVVANAAGDRVTPALVAFTDHDQSVGLPAKQGLIRNVSNTVCNVKQLVGRKFDNPEVQLAKQKSHVRILNNSDMPVYEVDYKERKTTFKTTEIVSLIYRNMREIAQSHGEGNIHDAVLTVPSYFSEEQRNALTAAGKKAGFTVLRVISESVAAVLAYDIGQDDISEGLNILVYRMGGTSLDVTVVNVNSGMYRIEACVTDGDVGGHIFTDVLVEHFAAEFKRQWKSDVHENKRSMAKLRNSSELCKHILSTMPSTQSSVESLYDGIDFQSSLGRARFEVLCNGLLQQCVSPIVKLLAEAGLQKKDIKKVILCGGSTKIPILQQKITDFFSEAEILTRLAPDEVIAIGAAKQAGLLTGNEMEEIQHNASESELSCLSASLGIKLGCGSTHVIFPKNTPIPSRRQKAFVLGPDQTSCCVEILSNCDSAGDIETTTKLAKVVMKELPSEAEISTVFHLRSDGSVHVTCTENKTKRTEDVIIEAS